MNQAGRLSGGCCTLHGHLGRLAKAECFGIELKELDLMQLLSLGALPGLRTGSHCLAECFVL